MLFNLAADAFDHILNQAKIKGHIGGLAADLLEEGGVTHLQYDDDTIILMDYNDQTIINMKFLLYRFEWLTGVKINYHKSEVLVMGSVTWSSRELPTCSIVR